MEGVIWAAVKVCEIRASWRQRMESSISAPPSRRGGGSKEEILSNKESRSQAQIRILPATHNYTVKCCSGTCLMPKACVASGGP